MKYINICKYRYINTYIYIYIYINYKYINYTFLCFINGNCNTKMTVWCTCKSLDVCLSLELLLCETQQIAEYLILLGQWTSHRLYWCFQVYGLPIMPVWFNMFDIHHSLCVYICIKVLKGSK